MSSFLYNHDGLYSHEARIEPTSLGFHSQASNNTT